MFLKTQYPKLMSDLKLCFNPSIQLKLSESNAWKFTSLMEIRRFCLELGVFVYLFNCERTKKLSVAKSWEHSMHLCNHRSSTDFVGKRKRKEKRKVWDLACLTLSAHQSRWCEQDRENVGILPSDRYRQGHGRLHEGV